MPKSTGDISIRRARTLDVIELLKADHREIEGLFVKVALLKGSVRQKAALVRQICRALTIHAQVEEEIVDPIFRWAGVDSDSMDRAEVEHDCAKRLIADLEGMSPGDDLYDARILILFQYVLHHVKEEENDIFQQAAALGVDLAVIGNLVEKRKHDLIAGTNSISLSRH
jgi:hemerythrin superfamily protein